MRPAQIDADAAVAGLRSTRDGLCAAEAARRLREYGPNRVDEQAGPPLALVFARQFTHFFAIVLWAAAALAFLAESREPGQGMASLGIAIVAVTLLNGAFGFWQEYRAERAVAALGALLPREVTALRDGAAQRLPAAELVPGDVILVQAGDDVPADCRLIEAFGVRVNLANVTGESLPKPRVAQAVSEDEPLRARNLLLAGTSVVAGEGRALVYATGMATQFGRIAGLTQSAPEQASPLQREIARLSRLVAALAAALGVVFFLVGNWLGLGFWHSFLFGIGIIVANVPEGLLPTVTLALAMATQRMARRNALVKHLPAAEALGSVTVIVTDKTGTLTENRMRVSAAFVADGPIDPRQLDARRMPWHGRFLEVARHCHNVREVLANGTRRRIGDPTELALIELAQAAAPVPEDRRIDEIAFDADRMCMSTLHQAPEGRILYCKGAPEVLLPLCSTMDGASGRVPLDDALRDRLLAEQEAMAERGLRVLALAWRSVEEGEPRERWEQGLTFAGLAGLEDPPRREVPQAIARCREAGIRVIMATGDHRSTARAVARQIGLGENIEVVSGEELTHWSDTQLQLALDREPVVFARLTADHKMRIVDALKRKGHVVGVTGDGVNDAPALKRADIGIAMGVVGTDVAREAADVILLDDNFASIVAAVEEGRAVFENIRKFLTYILTSNIPEIVPYLAFALLPVPLALTVIQILAVDLGTDIVPALALGAEKPAPGLMQRPPRPSRERLLSGALIARAYLWLGPMQAAASMSAFFFVLYEGGWSYGQPLASNAPLYLQATAACLASIVVMQVVNVFVCRDALQSATALRLASNPLLLAGVALEIAIILAITYTPAGNVAFGTAPFPAQAWLVMLPFAAAMFAFEEVRKWMVRGMRGRSRG